jgi:hypothetical protein
VMNQEKKHILLEATDVRVTASSSLTRA